MDIEILARFPQKKKKKSEEDAYLDYAKKIIDPEAVIEEEPEFVYDPVIFDVNDIMIHMRLDRDHTQINLKNGSFFIAKVPFQQFKEVIQQLTGRIVTKIVYTTPEEMRERLIGEPPVLVDSPKKRTRRRKDDEIDGDVKE